MARSLSALLFFVILIMASCGNDDPIDPPIDQEDPKEDPKSEEPQQETYFTLNVDADLITGDIENWIILHDQDGALLDYKKYLAGDLLNFKKRSDSLPESITITKIDYRETSNYPAHFLNSYSDIAIGSTWNFKNEQNIEDVTEDEIGKFTLTIKEIPTPHFRLVTDKNGYVQDENPFGGGSFAPGLYLYVYDKYLIKESNKHVISILDGNNEHRFKIFENVIDNDSIVFDYSSFDTFDEHVEIPIPTSFDQFNFVVKMYENDQPIDRFGGYFLFNLGLNDNDNMGLNSAKAGYLSEFDKYYSSFNLKNDGYSYWYKKSGAMPDTISPPSNPSLVVENSTFENYSFSTNVSYQRKTSLWYSKENFTDHETIWLITSDEGEFPIIGTLPQEIIEKYPKINVDNLEYRRAYLYLNGTYEGHINQNFIAPESGIDIISESINFKNPEL